MTFNELDHQPVMPPRGPLVFRGEFVCVTCKNHLTFEAYNAVVKSVGAHVMCHQCEQQYVVTDKGATPIEESEMNPHSFLDATGKPFPGRRWAVNIESSPTFKEPEEK